MLHELYDERVANLKPRFAHTHAYLNEHNVARDRKVTMLLTLAPYKAPFRSVAGVHSSTVKQRSVPSNLCRSTCSIKHHSLHGSMLCPRSKAQAALTRIRAGAGARGQSESSSAAEREGAEKEEQQHAGDDDVGAEAGGLLRPASQRQQVSHHATGDAAHGCSKR